ncbi:MAG: AMP-binding protein [Proteobacteria bacterium]|nr:AMP-binding protein [Pseudomonadota bacterium]MBU1057246.1 AMP-binding protein [Pseudomonadota bacterium]
MSVNIAATLAERAEEQGEEIGLVEAGSGKSLTFAQLNRRADSFAHILSRKGVRAGERVMLMVRPSADFICLTFALFKIGAPVILIDPGMGYRNLLRCIEGVRPKGFVGIPKAHVFRLLFRRPFQSVQLRFCCGPSLGLFGPDISKLANQDGGPFPAYEAQGDELAAIIFTTGSTGPPKGVRYEHGVFHAQLRLIRDYYGIGPGQTDQPAFPLFALFSTALGAKAIIPDMDPTRPAQVDPKRFVASIKKYGVTYSFGSPAIWNVIAGYGESRGLTLETLEKVLMAGAPVSGELISRMQNILGPDAQIHTPYGATESLPIVSIEGREIVEQTWPLTRVGKGTCVGRPLPGIEIAILPICDHPLDHLGHTSFLPPGEIGEIIVRGDVVTGSYENNPEENRLAKIADGNGFWHRMGDVGYLDQEGRLWFCGRRAHRVVTAAGTFFTIPCEAVYNVHAHIYRTALVGVAAPDNLYQIPVIIIEPEKDSPVSAEQLIVEARRLGAENPLTREIQYYLIHRDFPVDIRHNAKIFREKLSVWAVGELEGKL